MKKKIKKNSIDILSEIDGKPVYPSSKKDKPIDLSQEIKNFLEGKINHDSIKRIILRMERGPISDYDLAKSKMKATKVCSDGFFILIVSKTLQEMFFLDSYNFFRLKFFGGTKEIVTSQLKSKLKTRIHVWLEDQQLPFEMD